MSGDVHLLRSRDIWSVDGAVQLGGEEEPRMPALDVAPGGTTALRAAGGVDALVGSADHITVRTLSTSEGSMEPRTALAGAAAAGHRTDSGVVVVRVRLDDASLTADSETLAPSSARPDWFVKNAPTVPITVATLFLRVTHRGVQWCLGLLAGQFPPTFCGAGHAKGISAIQPNDDMHARWG